MASGAGSRAPPLGTLRGVLAGATPLEKLGWLLAAILCAAYLAFFLRLTSFPLQDYPNHLARAAAIADLLFHHGGRVGQLYQLHLMPVPYVLHDLLLAASVEVFGVVGGASVFTALVLLSLPCAVLFYLHVNRLAPHAGPIAVLLTLYLATDWFFLMAFTAFRLAVAEIIVCLALADLLRRAWSAAVFVAYVAALVLGYLTHLTALVFFAPVIGVSALVRLRLGTTTVRKELYLFAPVAALLGLHFGLLARLDAGPVSHEYHFWWADLQEKAREVLVGLYRFGGRGAYVLMLLFLVCLLCPVLGNLRGWRAGTRWRELRKPGALEPLALTVTFALIYLALPRETADATYVDIRALPLVALFLLLSAFHLLPAEGDRRDSGGGAGMLVAATLLAAGNLGYLVLHLEPYNSLLSRYREVVASVPEGAHVLVIYTRTESSIKPLLHAGLFVELDRGGVTPYLFSGDHGDPMKYFRYRHRPYAPDEMWYQARQLRDAEVARGPVWRKEPAGLFEEHRYWYRAVADVEWRRVACEFDFLLVTEPFDANLVRAPGTLVTRNGTAALLALDKRNCGSGP